MTEPQSSNESRDAATKKAAVEKLIADAGAHLEQVCQVVERNGGDARALSKARDALGKGTEWLERAARDI